MWGMDDKETKICWVKWEKVTMPKNRGGLGIKDLDSFNISMLAKWRWNFFHQSDSLWTQVLRSKYGGYASLLDEQHNSQASHCSEWWRDIKKSCGGEDELRWFDSTMRWKLGDEKEIRFWQDKWLGDQSLLEAFPRIFVNSNQQQNKVADMGTWEGQEWRWCFQWRRNWFDRENEQWASFQLLIARAKLQKQIKDSWSRPIETSGMYTVNSAYKVIHNMRYPGLVDINFQKI
uniref:Ribonuclease H protein At1g65750 family n=1 Tax=Cajanus cajan TaxID=3821 RepID=A0A151TKI4_CAJCA|nr:Putative ribonuclease H protein At1g65750 family [Cajanus cajan]